MIKECWNNRDDEEVVVEDNKMKREYKRWVVYKIVDGGRVVILG